VLFVVEHDCAGGHAFHMLARPIVLPAPFALIGAELFLGQGSNALEVVRCQGLAAAKSLCSANPSRTSGLRASVEVHRFAKAFPESERSV
jgi:hypothetical protein